MGFTSSCEANRCSIALSTSLGLWESSWGPSRVALSTSLGLWESSRGPSRVAFTQGVTGCIGDAPRPAPLPSWEQWMQSHLAVRKQHRGSQSHLSGFWLQGLRDSDKERLRWGPWKCMLAWGVHLSISLNIYTKCSCYWPSEVSQSQPLFLLMASV